MARAGEEGEGCPCRPDRTVLVRVRYDRGVPAVRYGRGETISLRRCRDCGQVWHVRYQIDVSAGSSVEWRLATDDERAEGVADG